MNCVVLSYNHPGITAKTISSCLIHFSPEKIFLIHNGSESKHVQVLRSDFPQIQHLVIEQNRGFSGGANFGLNEALKSSDWVLFLTNDVILERLGPPPTTPGLGAVKIYFRNLKRIDSVGGKLDLVAGKLSHCRTRADFMDVQPHNFKYVPGTGFFIHRDFFEMSHGFDEKLGTYWEDVDLSLRCQKMNFSLSLEDQTEILHAVGKTCHGKSHYTTYLFQRNRKHICRKYSKPLSYYQKLKLELLLWKDWLRLGFQFVRAGKWQNFKLLKNAIFDEL